MLPLYKLILKLCYIIACIVIAYSIYVDTNLVNPVFFAGIFAIIAVIGFIAFIKLVDA